MTEEFADELLITTLKFWIKKIRRGDCTREQKHAVLNAIDSSGDVYGSIDEIAAYYGKSKEAVYSVIKRRYIGKPKRNVVLYSFSQFNQICPKSWHVNNSESKDKP